MLETVLAVLVITFLFLMLFNLSHLLTGKILVEHAAMRVARARAVGFNDFMITKTVRISTMATAGRCLTQDDEGNALSTGTLVSRMGSYLQAENDAETSGILDFPYWRGHHLGWDCSEPGGDVNELIMRVWQSRPLYGNGEDAEDAAIDGRDYKLTGEARIEGHYPFYLQ